MKFFRFTLLILSLFCPKIYSQTIPDFPLNFLEVSLSLFQSTLDDPNNSFSVITDPIQRKEFLDNSFNTLNDISNSLSDIIPSFQNLPIDISASLDINNKIDIMTSILWERISQYILDIPGSEYIYQGYGKLIDIQRFNTSEEIKFIKDEFEIFVPKLNKTIIDIGLEMSDFFSYPIVGINTGIKQYSFKISDILGKKISENLNVTIIIPIKADLCEDCQQICAIWKEEWIFLETKIAGLNKVECVIEYQKLKSLNALNEDKLDTIAVFGIKNEEDNSFATWKIILIVSLVTGFFLISYYAYHKSYKKVKTLKCKTTYQSIV